MRRLMTKNKELRTRNVVAVKHLLPCKFGQLDSANDNTRLGAAPVLGARSTGHDAPLMFVSKGEVSVSSATEGLSH